MMETGHCQGAIGCPAIGQTVTRADGFLQWACDDHRSTVEDRFSYRLAVMLNRGVIRSGAIR